MLCFVSFHLLLCWSAYLTHHQPLFVFLGIPAASVRESSRVKAPRKICQNTSLSLLRVLFFCSFSLWRFQCQLAPNISTCITFVLNKMDLLTLENVGSGISLRRESDPSETLTFSNMRRFAQIVVKQVLNKTSISVLSEYQDIEYKIWHWRNFCF